MPKQKLSKIAIGVCAALVAIAAPLQYTRTAQADPFDDQIRAIQQQVNQFQANAGELRKKGDSLQVAVDTIVAEKHAIQALLDLNQAKYDKLTVDIAANKKKLADNQAALGSIIADLYVDTSISPLEMLASSKNVSDYIDKQEYRTAASEKLNTTISTVKELRATLEADQKATEKILEDQKAHRATLAAKEAEHQALLNQTRGEEAAYQQQIAGAKAEMSKVAAQQRAALLRATNGGRNNGGNAGGISFRNYSGNMGACGGGYGWNPQDNVNYCDGPLDSMVDQWSLYSRECVSYAAWAAYYRYNKSVSSFGGSGHAYQWPNTATRMGAVTDGNPEVGSIAIAPPSAFAPVYGHAMVVEAILGGGWVKVSQYNFGGSGEYSTMDISVSGLSFVHFRDR